MRRLTEEQVAEYLAMHGCELLSSYKGSMAEIRYRCECGNVATIKYADFRQGRRCGCGNKKRGISRRRPFDEVKKLFADAGCVLLAESYHHNKDPMPYICKCGNQSKICLSSFLNGRRCKQCGFKKLQRPNAKLNLVMKRRCSSLLQLTLKATGQQKDDRRKNLLGYTTEQLRERITGHPNWHGVRSGAWHIDHIFPIKAFVEHGILDLKIINHLDNLRPLSAIENMRKKDKYDSTAFKNWLGTKGVTI